MSLEERLAQMRAAEEMTRNEAARREKEQRSGELRGTIQALQDERSRLEQMRESLNTAYGRLHNAREEARSQRLAIEAIIAKHHDILATAGITKATELLDAEDFAEEPEVAAYRESRSTLGATGRDVGEEVKTARKELAIDRPDYQEQPTATSEHPVRERIFGAIRDRIAALDAQIQQMEAQTPEAQAERERKQALFDRVSKRRRPNMGNDRDNGPTVFREDLKEAKEFGEGGEDAVREAIVRQMGEQVDQVIAQKRMEDGIPGLEEDLKLFEENQRAFEEASAAYENTQRYYGSAMRHFMDLAPPRGWDRDVWASRQIANLIGRQLDAPYNARGQSSHLPREYKAYVSDISRGFWGLSRLVGRPEGSAVENRAWGSKATWRTEDFRATLDQINRVNEVLQDLMNADKSLIEELDVVPRKFGEPSKLAHAPRLPLHDQTIHLLLRGGGVEGIAQRLSDRHQKDDERALQLKKAATPRVDRDWKEAVYTEFENDPHTKEVITQFGSRERDLPLAREVIPMIDVLRRKILEHPDVVVNFRRAGSLAEVRPSEDAVRDYEAWQEVVRKNDSTLRSLGEKRQDLRYATGLTRVMERGRLNREITKLENQLVDKDEVSSLARKYQRTDEWRQDVEQSVRRLYSKTESNRRHDQVETLQLKDWIDRIDARFRPILETKISEEDQAILDRHRDFERRRNHGYWAT